MSPHIKVIGRGCSQLSNVLATFNSDNPDAEGTVEVYSPKVIGENFKSWIDSSDSRLSVIYTELNGLVEECLSQGVPVVLTGETACDDSSIEPYIQHLCQSIDSVCNQSLFIIDKKAFGGLTLSDSLRSNLTIDIYSERFYVRYPKDGI